MKKFFYITLILMFCLGFSSTVFGAKSWSVAEFEYFMKCAGYGDIDLDEYTYNGYLCKDEFLSRLSSTNYQCIFLKGNNSEKTGFSDTNFSVVLDNKLAGFNGYSYNNESFYKLQTMINSQYPNCMVFTFDTVSKTVNITRSYDDESWSYVPFNWYQKNNNVSSEEWSSSAFKTKIFEDACLFSEFSIPGTNFAPCGGRITSSSIDAYPDVIFNGSISYYPTAKSVSISYSSGFDSSVTYDLFLERYMLNATFENGIGEYPVEVIDIKDVTTNDTSFDLNIDDWALGISQAERNSLLLPQTARMYSLKKSNSF